MKKILPTVLLIMMLVFPTIGIAQTQILDLSSPKIGPSLVRVKTPLYEWTEKSIDYGKNHELSDTLYYAVGKSTLDTNTFIAKFTAKKKKEEGFFAFKHFVTKKSSTETVLELIPIPRNTFLVGYDFRDILQYERLILKKNPIGGINITSYITWIPSFPVYYKIIDRQKEIVDFDFTAIKASGDERLEQIGTTNVTVPAITVKGLEKKYDEYRVGKWDATNGTGEENNIKSIYPEIEFTKKISKDVYLYLKTTGIDLGAWNKERLDVLIKTLRDSKYKKTTYKNATIYSNSITSDGYYEIVIVPSKKIKGVYYVGNISLSAENINDYDFKLKKEQYNKFIPDVKVIRDELISILPSTENYPNMLKY